MEETKNPGAKARVFDVVPTGLVSNHFQEDLKRLYSLKDIYESYIENHKTPENEK